jgi:uncharacterized protein YcbK (DUF882 family)
MLRTCCRTRKTLLPAAMGLVPALLVAGWSGPAQAQRHAEGDGGSAVEHVVAEGETLGEIARQHGVTARAIEDANSIDDPDVLRVGQSLRIPPAAEAEDAPAEEPPRAARREREEPGGDEPSREAHVTRHGVVLYVGEGQTLSDIAGSYDVGVSRILRANDLTDANALHVGQRLLVPGAAEVVAVRRVRHEDPGSRPITFLRVATDEEVTVRLFDGHNRPISSAREKIDRLFRQPSTNREHRINTQLLRLIQRVADHWPGKRIWIYSGYRPYRRSQYTPKSKHNTGHAVDFRVEDVPNDEVRDFCRTLSDAGVGFYPHSHFVHLDARDRRAYWVDWSRPGEAPHYGREGRDPAGDEAAGDAEAAADRDSEDAPAAAPGPPEGEGEQPAAAPAAGAASGATGAAPEDAGPVPEPRAAVEGRGVGAEAGEPPAAAAAQESPASP